MPETLSATIQATAFGRPCNKDISITSETGQPWSPTVAKAWAGQLTTRTDANTGVVTMADAGHAIANGTKVMVYWEDDVVAHTAGRRRFQSVTGVAGTAVTLDLGAGDNFPTVLTNVIICTMEQVNVALVGDDCMGIALPGISAEMSTIFHAGDASELLYVALSAQAGYVWTSAEGITNPLAGVSVATVWVGHNNTGSSMTCPGAIYKN